MFSSIQDGGCASAERPQTFIRNSYKIRWTDINSTSNTGMCISFMLLCIIWLSFVCMKARIEALLVKMCTGVQSWGGWNDAESWSENITCVRSADSLNFFSSKLYRRSTSFEQIKQINNRSSTIDGTMSFFFSARIAFHWLKFEHADCISSMSLWPKIEM